MNVRYTVSRCREDGTLYRPLHGSIDSRKTLCGQYISEYWRVVSSDFDGEVTCGKCKQIGRGQGSKRGGS